MRSSAEYLKQRVNGTTTEYINIYRMRSKSRKEEKDGVVRFCVLWR